MQLLNEKPKSLTEVQMRYCPGCGHPIVHRLIAEVMDELDIQNKTIGIAPVGCAVFADEYFNCDMIQGPHGRGPAIATGIKRNNPDYIVFSYQGDGDLASIGMAEIIHAANRGISITVVFVNNAIYGMTGGQMAPTTLIGQKSTTTPHGRDPAVDGFPVKMCELLASIESVKFLERTKVNSPSWIRKTKRAIERAFRIQIEDTGFSMVEVLSMCPTNWHLDPIEALEFVDRMAEIYPVGVYKE